MKYETVLILDADMDETALDAEIKKIKSFLDQSCEKVNFIHWGKRKLAYTIKKKNYGDYAIFEFETAKNIIAEMERGFRINEKVLRYITLKKV